MVGSQASDPGSAASSSTEVRWFVPLCVIVIGMFMAVLDATIVNVALPRIQGDLGADTEDVLWVATAYTLTLGVVVPLSGWLADRFGLKRMYLATLLAFCVGSALCGMAWDLSSLIAFRIVQAVPGGLLPVMSLTLINVIVPAEKIGAAMGLYGLGIVAAPAIGPVLGGWMVDNFHWSLIFYINVPIGLAGALAAWFVLKNVGRIVHRRFDVLGFLTIGSSLFALLLAFSMAEDWGWTSYRILMLFAYGALALALFVVIELEVEQPLLDVRVFGCWAFSNCMFLLFVVTTGLLGALYYLPVFMQLGQGLTATEAGVRILPQAAVIAVLMPITGRLYDKIGPRPLAFVGFVFCAYGNWLLHDLTAYVTHEDLVWWTMIRGVGMGLCTMPVMTTGIAALGPARVSAGSSWTMVVRQTSGAIPLAILSAVATGQQSQLMSDKAALLTPQVMRHNGVPMPVAGDATSIYGVAGVYKQTKVDVLASSYADVFLITAALCVIAALLSLALPGRPKPKTDPPAGAPGTGAPSTSTPSTSTPSTSTPSTSTPSTSTPSTSAPGAGGRAPRDEATAVGRDAAPVGGSPGAEPRPALR